MGLVNVSIIVPVYNVSVYLRRCLDSCVYQTMSEIEVIVVNDASPDPADYEIMREYEQKYPNKIRCIFLKDNHRLGGARNAGVDVAIGKYITFVDSDDYIDFKFCEILYAKALLNNSDLVLCNFYTCANGVSLPSYRLITEGINKLSELKSNSNLPVAAWACLVRKSLLLDNALLFPEHVLEDLAVTPLWLIIAKNLAGVDDMLYFYMIRNSSISHDMTMNKFNVYEHSIKHLIDRAESLGLLFEYVGALVLIICQHLAGAAIFVHEFFPDNYREWVFAIKKAIEPHWGETKEIDLRNTTDASFFAEMIVKIKEEDDCEAVNLAFKTFTEKSFLQRKRFLCELCDELKQRGKKRICVWGAGENGTRFAELLAGTEIDVEYTDINCCLHGKVMPNGSIVKKWSDISTIIDVVIICTSVHFTAVKSTVDSSKVLIDWEKYLRSNISAAKYIDEVSNG